jgi:predicted O-methyltransferase YrrM
MNPVLHEILAARQVQRGDELVPLHSHMDPREGELITSAFSAVKPDISLEIGMAYGISTLFACEALAANEKPCRHIVLDPYQATDWKGLGVHNVKRAGYARFLELREERSEILLARLLNEGVEIDCAIIDGWHTFDHALLDFFYVNKMLRVGGVVILDDTDFPALSRLTKHILSYPCYELFGSSNGPVLSGKPHARLRRLLSRTLKVGALMRPWETRLPTAMAFRKNAPDERSWDWHQDF